MLRISFNAKSGFGYAQLRNMGFPLTWSLCDEVVYNDPRFQVIMHEIMLSYLSVHLLWCGRSGRFYRNAQMSWLCGTSWRSYQPRRRSQSRCHHCFTTGWAACCDADCMQRALSHSCSIFRGRT